MLLVATGLEFELAQYLSRLIRVWVPAKVLLRLEAKHRSHLKEEIPLELRDGEISLTSSCLATSLLLIRGCVTRSSFSKRSPRTEPKLMNSKA